MNKHHKLALGFLALIAFLGIGASTLKTVIYDGLLQTDLDAGGFNITNLNPSFYSFTNGFGSGGGVPIETDIGSSVFEDGGLTLLARNYSGGGFQWSARNHFGSYGFSGYHLVADGGTWLYQDGAALALASLSGTNVVFGPDTGLQKIGVVASGGFIGDGFRVTNLFMAQMVSNAQAFVSTNGNGSFGGGAVVISDEGVFSAYYGANSPATAQFQGNGSLLTSLPAGQLAGTAPQSVVAGGTATAGYVPVSNGDGSSTWGPNGTSYDLTTTTSAGGSSTVSLVSATSTDVVLVKAWLAGRSTSGATTYLIEDEDLTLHGGTIATITTYADGSGTAGLSRTYSFDSANSLIKVTVTSPTGVAMSWRFKGITIKAP